MDRNTSLSSSARIQRNMKERDRRTLMKHHLSRLESVLGRQSSKMTVPNLIDEAVKHVREMHDRIEELKVRKAQAAGGYVQTSRMDDQVACKQLKNIETEVNLVSGLNKNFMLHEVIHVLQEEGAQAISPRIGIDTVRVHERLKGLMDPGLATASRSS
ncbi:conserved hypothetical protein [Ricinus communis]|uniref:BHLH domain-containing protein n=1 Tax=Ricinus communis TaxID=3988 RepID=B9SHB7_RICCO|nr:conserved hypothetical protein [Ricinus communis]